MSGVSLRSISKHFGTVRALDDVSLDVDSGELVALLGPSGCGKTTLLRSVAGLETPTSGTILIGNRDVSLDPPRKRPIGMVFQSYALFPNMTIRDNIGFPLKVRKRPNNEIKKRTDELIELVGLGQQANRYPHQISGGQQQRGALARALAPNPEVLLLDEPLSALDAMVRTRLRDEIRRIQQMVKITAVYVTHDQSEAMAIADRVAVMNHGRIEQIAQPPDLYEDPTTRFSASFVGNRNAIEVESADGKVQLGLFVACDCPKAGRAVLYFRPEDVEFTEDGGEPATIESKLFLGSQSRLYLTIGGNANAARLYADVPSRQALPLQPGQTVRIRLDPSHARVFPLE